MGSERRGQGQLQCRSPAPWVPSRGPQPLHFRQQALPTALKPARPPGPTFGGESLPLQQVFHQPLDLFQLWVFPFHLEDSQILIGASVTEPGDPDPDSVLRILLLAGGTHRETQNSAVTPGLGAACSLLSGRQLLSARYSLSNRSVSQASE